MINNLRLGRSMEHAIMKKHVLLTLVIALGLLSVLLVHVRQAAQRAGHHTQGLCSAHRLSSRWNNHRARFRAQSTRFAPLSTTLTPTMTTKRARSQSGHREINWDGGNTANVATMISGTPFDGFLVTRGALFTTRTALGSSRRAPAGLADVNVFNNPTYGTIFRRLACHGYSARSGAISPKR